MAASTVTRLPYQQWRLMNALDRNNHRPAPAMLTRYGVGPDDILDLWDAGLIAATFDGNDIDLSLVALDREILRTFDIHIGHSRAGGAWVRNHPANRALRWVDELGSTRTGAPLQETAEAAGVAWSTFLLLAAGGLVDFVDTAGHVHEVNANSTMALKVYGPSLRVRLTTKGRDLVGGPR